MAPRETTGWGDWSALVLSHGKGLDTHTDLD